MGLSSNQVPGCEGWYYGLLVSDGLTVSFDLRGPDDSKIKGLVGSKYRTTALARAMGEEELRGYEEVAISAVLSHQVRGWAEENVIGKEIVSQETLARVGVLARSMIADRMGLEPGRVNLEGLRFEEMPTDEGGVETAITWDHIVLDYSEEELRELGAMA